ncbi:dipeptide ABC transporter ATP-binding protein [Amycolatopsis endophytica]|uniref:Peptide/nickel transport system ATP-binding protein n=1 Tax=Amycolatopsis endophytica TaxID=860233 RepID=A0A853B4L0_9PSEU|nr:ABC transporter ATP-binding protein [Amycolatopsis endophytica]NYI90108.1 peptide/nickel transport system ATP-binding protein [Amycolatopsis endophytica]
MSAPLLELDHVDVVHKIRGRGLFGHDCVHALTDATLTVRPGETIGVVGESGCGKTTLAKVVVGLRKPTGGTVRHHGKPVWDKGSDRREFGRDIGMVFQDPTTALNRRMSIERIVRDPLDVHQSGTPSQRAGRVRELMDLVGLPSSVADAVPGQLSGGQRQRVAIARALALEPALLVADEPTSALDVSVRAQILNLLLDLRERLGLAMIFVSHDIQTVRKMSDRIVTMYLGRIVEDAPAGAIPAEARHPYTRALFSATPSLLNPIDPIVLTGPVPSAVNPPSGCAFRTRCPKATDACATEVPPASAAGDGHLFHCIHPEPEVSVR